MKVINNKRGDITYYIVGIIISVLAFFIYMIFFTNVTGSLVSESDDLYCRGVLSARSNAAVKTGEFFLGEITQKCKKDEYVETVKNKEDIYEIFGESMKRCWYRYGEGQYDFMSSYNKEGNWCFTCAKIEIKDKSEGTGVYLYNDLIEWMRDNDIRYKNGTKVSYYDYMNLKYAIIEDKDELAELKGDIEDLLNDGDSYMRDLSVMFSEQYNYMQDLRLKEIRTDEDLYVVYRYDKPDVSASEKFKQTMWGAGTGFTASLAVSLIAENALTYGVTGAVCLFGWTGVGTVACGAMVSYSGTKTAKSIAKGAKSAGEGIKKVASISKKLSKFIRLSKTTVSASEKFTGGINEIEKILSFMQDLPKLAKKFENIKDTMNKLGIKHIDEISSSIKDYENKASDIDHLMEISENILESEEYLELVSHQKEYLEQVNNLKSLKEYIKKAETEYSYITDAKKKEEKLEEIVEGKKKYVYGTILVAGTASGAYAGSNLNFHSNQYVDVMTKEQYYRLCGTEPSQLSK